MESILNQSLYNKRCREFYIDMSGRIKFCDAIEITNAFRNAIDKQGFFWGEK